MTPTNLLVITSDEHNKRHLGCYGSDMVQTPNLDRLAEMGTRFTNAYTPSPICMPARAALATGRYLYETENWDNGSAYRGTEADSWGHRLSDQGHNAPTYGKLHYHPECNSGYDEHLPLHAKLAEDGYIGAVASWLGEDAPIAKGLRKEILGAEAGEFGYTRYDRSIAEAASEWLKSHELTDKPWCTYVSFTYPHYPFVAPKEYVDLYDPDAIELPVNWEQKDWSDHPALKYKRHKMGLDVPVSEAEMRHAMAVYFGMVTFLDAQVGKVLDALAESPFAYNTRIIYSSDHGEMLGEHGFWFKGTMHEGSAGIPMIFAGPDVPQNHVCNTPVSLIDVYPTAVASVGAQFTNADANLNGRDLVQIANAPDESRAVMSSYHSVGAKSSTFMIMDGRWKYIESVGYPARLFDLETDPEELSDLANDPAYADKLSDCAQTMRSFCDPEVVEAKVQAHRKANVERMGGVETLKGKMGNNRPFTPAPEKFG